MHESPIHRTVEAVWRMESAKIIAKLARMLQNVGLAEEIAQDALVTALEQWPRSGLPDNAAALIADDEVGRYQVLRVADEIVVDLMAAACGIDYAAALAAGVETLTIQGVAIPVACKELLIRMKDTIRPSDAADVNFLRVRIAEDLRQGRQGRQGRK